MLCGSGLAACTLAVSSSPELRASARQSSLVDERAVVRRRRQALRPVFVAAVLGLVASLFTPGVDVDQYLLPGVPVKSAGLDKAPDTCRPWDLPRANACKFLRESKQCAGQAGDTLLNFHFCTLEVAPKLSMFLLFFWLGVLVYLMVLGKIWLV